MKKVLITCGITTLALISLFMMSRRHQSTTKSRSIALIQTASHPALDAVKNGFIEEARALWNNDIEIVTFNAQGAIDQAHTIAQQVQANTTFDGFFAIATPAAMAISSVEKDRPIFIAAVTDPKDLGLLDTNRNICGTTDMIDVAATVDMLRSLIPHAKNVALLFTNGEPNSIALVEKMKHELKKNGLQAIPVAFNNEADVQAATELACRKADVLLCPTDNTVAMSIAFITSIARKHKKPVITSDNTLVCAGALAARGVDYHDAGKQTARIAHQVLEQNAELAKRAPQAAKCPTIVVNTKTCRDLDITIPEELKPLVKEVS